MSRRALTSPAAIATLLLLQFVPLILFPASSFGPTTQEWWLPVLLAFMVLLADFDLIVRRSERPWPWKLMSFSQGFNIISRLMMVWPHATVKVGNAWVADTNYLVATALSIALSAFVLWYVELPEVRIGLYRR